LASIFFGWPVLGSFAHACQPGSGFGNCRFRVGYG
jgi:hypothetical protein